LLPKPSPVRLHIIHASVSTSRRKDVLPRFTHTQQAKHTGSPEASQTISLLRNHANGAEIFLVGTAHVSKKSAVEVRDVINVVKPDIVMLELCPGRAERLRAGQPASDTDFLKGILGSLFAPGANLQNELVKISFQSFYRILKHFGLAVGSEFIAAMEAGEQQGATIVYGDRDVRETISRLASVVKMEDIFQILVGKGPSPPRSVLDALEQKSGSEFEGIGDRLESQVEFMKRRSIARDLANFLRQINPQVAAALIDERDEVMVQNLRRLKGRVVGVVGLAHLDGIEKRWEALHQGNVAPLHAPCIVNKRQTR